MDVIIAARLSKVAKGHAQSGIETQDEDAREWAEDEGHTVIETVADYASGTKAMHERKNLGPWVTDPDLMARYQGIVAAKQDRLSRADFMDEVDLRRWAEENHKTLFIVDRELRWPPREGAHHDDDITVWNRGAEEAHREWSNTSRRYKRMLKNRVDNNELTGRPAYGYRSAGINCGESPCRCWEKKIDDRKTLAIYEPEAQVIREAKDRYLGGESVEKICDDFKSRGIPAPMGATWWPRTLSKVLRNPSTAGRRMDNSYGTDEQQRKTILTYPGIITWTEHEQIAARMDSRSHRKGISPYNVAMLTGIVTDRQGHVLYHVTNPRGKKIRYYACRKRCGICVPLVYLDGVVNDAVLDEYGDHPHMVRRIVPGKNHFEEIARLRQGRAELDDLADDYPERHAALTAEIRRMAKEDKENPQPDEIRWVPSGQTIAEYWQSLTVPGRHDWLVENGWKVRVAKDDGEWVVTIDAGFTAEISAERQAKSPGAIRSV